VGAGSMVEETVMHMQCVGVHSCRSLRTWMYCSWDIRLGYVTQYLLVRQRGVRILGVECWWTYVQKGQ
jgi:hypothetical protein